MAQSPIEVARKMFNSTREIRTLTFKMTKKERIDGELLTQTSRVKLSLHPFRVYSYQLDPKSGLELLYCEGQRNNKALINPNGFPWFTLKLDPMGSTMRHHQHHTVLNSGYDHVVSILEFLFDKYDEELARMVSFQEEVNWDGHACYVIRFLNPHFKYIHYTMKANENFLDLCKRLKLSEHMVMEMNSSIDDFDEELDEGDQIVIPNDYSPQMIIYIDQERMIPLMMKVYDDKGIYEIYEYYDVEVNPNLSEEEFTEDYQAYDF